MIGLVREFFWIVGRAHAARQMAANVTFEPDCAPSETCGERNAATVPPVAARAGREVALPSPSRAPLSRREAA